MLKNNQIFYKKSNWPIILIIGLVMAYICGFKLFGIDRDYYNYLDYFETLQGFASEKIFNFKIGFELITKSLISLSKDFNFYLFWVAFFSILPKLFLIAKHSRNLTVSIFIYSLLIFPIHEMTQIRSGIAYGFFYLGIFFYINYRKIFGIFLLITSFTLHISCLPLALLYFLFSVLIKDDHKIIVQVFRLLFIFFVLYFLSIYGSSLIPLGLGKFYFFSNTSTNIFSLRYLCLLLINFIGLKFQKSLPVQAKSWQKISLCGIIVFYSMIGLRSIPNRILEATFFSYLLWIDYLPKNARILSKIILTFIALINFYLVFIKFGGFFTNNYDTYGIF